MTRMSTLGFLIVLFLAIEARELEDIVSRRELQSASWVSCIADPTMKWCKLTSSTTTGNCCASFSTASACGGSSSYICSNNAGLPQNSGKLLCPKDTTNCGTQAYNLSSATSKYTFKSSTINTNAVCWYEAQAYSSSITQIKIQISRFAFPNFLVKFYWQLNQLDWFWQNFGSWPTNMKFHKLEIRFLWKFITRIKYFIYTNR